MRDCVVVYPGGTIVTHANGSRAERLIPSERVHMIFHGITHKKPTAAIVEDSDGIIHVVATSILELR